MFRKLLFSLLCVHNVCVNGDSKVCSLRDLPFGNISKEFHCTLKDQPLHVDVESALVPVITRCKEPGEILVEWECFEGKWRKSTLSDLDLTLDLSHKTQHRRHKRFFGFFVALLSCAFLCFTGGRNGPPPDRTPPMWNFCPSDQFLTGIPGQLYAFAEWVEPKAYDDRDGAVRVGREGEKPRSHFGHGTTVIRYTAKDRSGNMAPPCSFRVVVKDVRHAGQANLAWTSRSSELIHSQEFTECYGYFKYSAESMEHEKWVTVTFFSP